MKKEINEDGITIVLEGALFPVTAYGESREWHEQVTFNAFEEAIEWLNEKSKEFRSVVK